MSHSSESHGTHDLNTPTDNLEAGAGDLVAVAWRYCGHDINGDPWPWVYTETKPAAHAEVEPLYSAAQLAAVTAERDAAKGKLALIVDRIIYSDSYGVPGSDFACCHLCTGGGAPGIPFEHDEHCPVRSVERDYEQWFDDIRVTEDALREAEAALARLREALEPFAALGEVVLAEAPADAVAAWSFASSDGPHLITLDAFRAARAALSQEAPK